MSYKNWIFLIPLLIFGAVSLFTRPVLAGPSPQIQYQTPTARPDGRVIYIVQDGDSCLRIQLLTGVTDEALRELNRLDQNCNLSIGQELVLRVVTPEPTTTPNPLMTNTPLLPTPTPEKGRGNICVVLFDDINGNAVHESSEPVIGGSAVSITNRSGNISRSGATTANSLEPMCEELTEGEYNISMAVPVGFNATTMTNRPVMLQAGDQAILEFGVQVSTIQPPPEPETTSSDDLLLAIVGGVLVMAGMGLGIYAFAFNRRS